MMVIPAIDLKDGQCVRLVQGDMEQVTVFGSNPAEIAKQWSRMGAAMLHIVDLNGAFARKLVNHEAISQIVTATNIPAELGGGIRDMQTLDSVMELGISHAILGTVAVSDPGFVRQACRAYPGRIRVGIDAQDGMVAVNGWAEITSVRAVELAKSLEDAGVEAIIYTDISRDGLLQGMNIEECASLARSISIPVIASGGLTSLDDIRRLKEHEDEGICGLIAGKAIYTGAVDLKEAIAIATS
ncbi:1-(5-phosphoribosyl)-5-[(5-phosphoribosylamino)methylideneamino]imidazole-4-carboxamide isomerase [Desulfurispira natronophila]|uniref:1-(5-phosphoribosyl)-5-[(5-phosphoribosylamino)methylideneamino] imidazole-4-carboxamide isomerase n=1 Tax=Desulfurispira natronophila TaxID=682562 RepID=A0A7W7Y2H9_9BACT|nr:1-(5-phosphoribosyl)-5-[(5-phosphoribosylamino)methylideneamino]imidazole-4-carboxamide isomerase [Desulfurispira natronophila]MBB5020900.1 phosphoribosylformimino-5-aminoimidazole carboxamide ribotide isomerase [Desulfurispira natronophila]